MIAKTSKNYFTRLAISGGGALFGGAVLGYYLGGDRGAVVFSAFTGPLGGIIGARIWATLSLKKEAKRYAYACAPEFVEGSARIVANTRSKLEKLCGN